MSTALHRLAGKLPRSWTFLPALLKGEWPVLACPIWKDPRQAVADWFLIVRKYVRSFFTRDRALEDYPFRVGCVEALNRQPGREPWVGDFWIAHVIN